MRHIEALVLEILKQDDSLKMSLFEQEEAASTLRHYSQYPVSFAEINKLCHEAVSLLNRVDKGGALNQESIKGLIKTGQVLWDHLLVSGIKNRLRNSQNTDLILSIDEELINIPWELLYDGNNFLCLNFNVGRVVRTRQESNPVRYRSFSNILRMLVLANPTNDLKSAYLEGLNIKNQLGRRRSSVLIDFKSTFIDKMYVKKNLRDYDIVHFAGHCEYDAANPKDTGWVLSDGKFTTQDILSMGSAVSLPSLVFSNACHSAKVSPDFVDEDYQKKSYSLASAFLFSGVRHYIGAIRRIEDPASLVFASEFYAQLISGKSMGECIRLARLSLIREYGMGAIPWASYLLYGDPSFVLFKSKPKPQASNFVQGVYFHKKYAKQLRLVSLIAVVISACALLYAWLPTVNPTTYFLFSKSQKLYLKGNNQEVVSLCSQVLEKEPLFLAAYPLLADTYQRIGDRENALRYYFDYALYSEKKQDKKSLAASYIGIGWLYHLNGEYAKANDFYNKALNLSKENNDRLNEAVALRKLAVWCMDKGDDARALELLTKSSEINREREHIYEHRYNLACDYFDKGLVFVNKDDLATAKEFYTKSQRLFEKMKVKKELSDYYFNLGEIFLFERQYQKALDYYFCGLKIDQAQGNILNLSSDYNMIGELYFEMDNLAEAEKFYNQALACSLQIKAKLESACAYRNLGILYKKRGHKNKAREFLRQAQEIYAGIDTPDYKDIKQELLDLSSS